MDIKTPSDFGFAIREAREEAKLSQQDLASKVGTTQARISRLERGNGAVNLRTILQILASLNLKISLLSANEHAETRQNNEQDEEDIDLDAIVDAGLKPSRRLPKR
jgi:HTH-type transcriptional regulator/antitoxin HipB